MTKETILAEIRRLATENEGRAPGQERFEASTGIAIGAWRGKYWRTWSDALAEAGLPPNRPNEAHTDEALLQRMLELTRQHGRFPTYTDLRMAKQSDSAFPTHHAFHRLGSREARIELLRDYAIRHAECADILEILPPSDGASHDAAPAGEAPSDGAVYMLKFGKHFKIGKTFSVPRRHRQIALELPEKPDIVHVITTDDPSGIEAYWHARFAAKRTNGEWFELTRADVQAFKRRKFM